ncbi:hypothetical protein Kpol_1010p49 [Vanderwaltozyma polyspora DSM 70294]|uniref:N-acetyltransferase SLI1 n=1 Tax=Vanderwaltozyma polyspora (strain ATCC 22028 / DSM 70294 / BCRC 21397 / CBS 2163 / NBRC 10782 / NRRL Y-8283 / UCD 57-17) TaxID=436907 RepID=A7TIJ5_VANPO|nr:uncharacterized protein Kpol_1010p49 [Vanderwaltozyma polyspora DSM 70294]EDO17933.1 hypothetical protein Kpol_1010p49 [Vanderwaltozyma polyspora DSM 70294]
MRLRKLSSLELYFYNRSKLNLHSCFYIGVTLNQLPTRTQIIHALRKSVAKYQQLRCNVMKAGDSEDDIYFNDIGNEKIYFADIVEYKNWDSVSESNINSIFQEYSFEYFTDKPVWKILVLENQNQLLMLLDHVLFDGMSGINFWNSFISSLPSIDSISEDANANELIFPFEEPSQIAVLGDNHPYENWPISTTWHIKRTLLKHIFKWYPGKIMSHDPQLIKFNSYSYPSGLLDNNSVPSKSQYTIKNNNKQYELRILPDELKFVLQYCRTKGFSLTSYLSSLFVNELRTVDSSYYNGSKIKIEIPMNTRSICEKELNLSPEQMELGNFITGLGLETEIDGEKISVEDLARSFQNSLKKQSQESITESMNTTKSLDVVNTKDFVEYKINPLDDSDISYPGATFEITNLGYQNFVENAGFCVVDAVFGQPQGISDNFFCSIVSTKLGGLNCLISYPTSLEVPLERCFDSVRDQLKEHKNHANA